MKIVGITACPAGLAHTPMAAKALEDAGQELQFDIKIEQQGAMGTLNKILPEEAQAADFVLIASDQKVTGMERFKGKKIIRVGINTALAKPKAVLQKCVAALAEQK